VASVAEIDYLVRGVVNKFGRWSCGGIRSWWGRGCHVDYWKAAGMRGGICCDYVRISNIGLFKSINLLFICRAILERS
jgi:hypothetical protein